MRKTAILLALACAFARADYGPGTTDSDLLRSGTPVVTNAWMAVSNDTARLVSRVAGDASRITDGTNTIDAARNVFLVYENCWIRRDGYVLTYIGDGTWKSIKETPYGYIYLDERSPGKWYETVIAIPDVYYRDGDTLTNDMGIVTYRYGPAKIPVGRLALTNDIPSAVSADLTPATNYSNQVAQDSTNYTDAVAGEFSDGTRTVSYSETSGFANTASSLIGDGTTYNAIDLIRESTNAAIAVADAKISTNNAAFVSAVLAVPLTGADAADLAELAEYGSYGTVGAALLALIAGLAALKRRVTSAETALAQKANASDLPYRLVEPGKWEFSGLPEGAIGASMSYYDGDGCWTLYINYDGETDSARAQGSENDLVVVFSDASITATRASLPGHLLDRAGNRVVVSGDTTLTLPALEHAGRLRDFLVRLEISGSTVPTITFAAPTGETLTYETDGDEFPVPDEAGDWLYSFTESCVAHKFAVSLKKVNVVALGGA